VKMAKHRILDIEIAMKIYDRKKMSPQNQRNLEREIDILKKMSHPNIIRLYHSITSEKNIHLAMEYTSPTSLETFMRGRPFKRLSEEDAKVIFR
jgi:MAP/microtubule affinity-regulating kinase